MVAALSLIIVCSAQSCQTRPQVVVYHTDALSVVLRELPTGYPSLEPYNHSYTIQPDEVRDILEHVQYEAGSLIPFSGKQSRLVFTRQQGELVAPVISNALRQAAPQDVVEFSLADQERPDRRTKGLVFILHDELHLIIEELRKPVYQGEPNTYQQPVPRWELLPGDRQRHYASRQEGKGTITNWIIIPLR
ncbi:MAG: hypothetical protein HP496_14765 [Nitrospira sp.]|nr:hypothetical protein [Nitrospira sp.]